MTREHRLVALVTATAAGRVAAAELEQRWDNVRRYDVADVSRAWASCDALVCFLAVGAVVRLLAPLLADKRTDPGVVCVDEARRFAVAVVGGHGGGANDLATRVGEALGATVVLTTASDAVGIPGLDELGWPVEGDCAAVGRAMLDGEPVVLVAEETWPLPALPVRVLAPGASGPAPCLVVTDRLVEPPRPAAVLRPPSLVVGVGASRGVPAEEVRTLVAAALAEAGLAAASIAELATVDAKSAEEGICAAARTLGVPLRSYPAARLAAVPVPHPSATVQAAVGTPSVAEAAALADGGTLVLPKRRSAMATVAIARRRPRGRLALVGLGPGARDLLTPRAVDMLRRSAVVVGLDRYLDQIADVVRPGTRMIASGLGAEEERARTAVELARAGHAVALVGGGDAGVYALAGPALALADDSIEVVGVPGITAALAVAARLGAPLGHDHCAISLSDLHTPWELIERRVRAAAEAEFVVSFYNPRSGGRGWQLEAALAVLREHRPGQTPVGVVSDVDRPGEQVLLTTLADVDVTTVGMTTLVVVGSSASRLHAGRFVTPRGYRWDARSC
ncbi:MAG TPA: precorrin-3B C(17)-methyltransferase [Mycobacteriales bacterium]|nr:precorrin-3B C(17)-methyltransferase [Mycobacteriales bacterium]